jgi:hypothetical protein
MKLFFSDVENLDLLAIWISFLPISLLGYENVSIDW